MTGQDWELCHAPLARPVILLPLVPLMLQGSDRDSWDGPIEGRSKHPSVPSMQAGHEVHEEVPSTPHH